jgi:hypothetical protein
VFADFAHDGRVLDLVDGLLGADDWVSARRATG